MSSYHSREAFTKRMAQRRAQHQVPEPLAVFWHIACMPSWEVIFYQQLELLGQVGLNQVTAGLLGPADKAAWCRQVARRMRVELTIGYASEELREYEVPTLHLLDEWARAHPQGAVLYFHTKGASCPGSNNHYLWRRLMERRVIEDWRRNLDLLAVADIVGASWSHSPDFPHFSGNFWLARCDWIANLPPVKLYQRSRHPNDRVFAGHPWERMCAETWIGSRPYHHIEERLGPIVNFWSGDHILRYLPQVWSPP